LPPDWGKVWFIRPDGAEAGLTGTHHNTGWEHFPHEADVGVRGIGATKGEAFENAAMAVTAAVVDPDALRTQECVAIACQAPGDDILLLDWLNAVVYEMATRRMLFGAFHVEIEGGKLEARACGESLDRGRHAPAVEVKGATLTELRVERRRDGRWVAQCVIDV
jgi:tRNA nucleotidyltransferase (CCA-adding enzyme)